MQIVDLTKKRSGWRVYRTLAALGLPRSVYYAWKKRDSLENRTGKPCRVYELLRMACIRSDVYEQKRASAIYGRAEN